MGVKKTIRPCFKLICIDGMLGFEIESSSVLGNIWENEKTIIIFILKNNLNSFL
jgi:hypothetical protein